MKTTIIPYGMTRKGTVTKCHYNYINQFLKFYQNIFYFNVVKNSTREELWVEELYNRKNALS